jgi:hypothetical protein
MAPQHQAQHQPAFHAHQIADHPVRIGVVLQLLQGAVPQTLSPIKGIDQLTRIEVEPHASPPAGPFVLQCGVDLLLVEALSCGNGGLQVQQLVQQLAASRWGSPGTCHCEASLPGRYSRG